MCVTSNIIGKNFNTEVKKVMSSSNFLINYDSTMRSMSSTSIPRKPKRYSKSSIAAMKYPQHKKGRMSSMCYLKKKKVVIFRFMPAQQKYFTRSEKLILVTGLLPSLPIDASEKDIRGKICDVIKSKDEFKDVTPEDFEFINNVWKTRYHSSMQGGIRVEWSFG